MDCFLSSLPSYAFLFIGFAFAVLCGAALVYIFATYAPLDSRRNDPGA